MRGAFANKFGLYYGKEGYDIEKNIELHLNLEMILIQQ